MSTDAPAPAPEPEPDPAAFAERIRKNPLGWLVGDPPPTWWLTRELVIRLLALIYLIAFLSLALQLPGLIGERGLMPVRVFLGDARMLYGTVARGFVEMPTLFWLIEPTNGAMLAVCWIGVVLSAAALAGVTHALLQLALWALYFSLAQVGQTFYGYGWEMLLLEAGVLSVFLCPLLSIRPLPSSRPPIAVLFLFRWLAFRLMFGAGLIKLRGDPCWRDLTCLDFHYETQPNPHPLAPLWHFMPAWSHRIGVAFNHFAELVAPWGLFGPRPVRTVAAIIVIVFQVALLMSGNLAFLNWLSIAIAVAAFDDRLLARLMPRLVRARVAYVEAHARKPWIVTRIVTGVVVLVVVVLSVDPIMNMISRRQAMNRSFDRLHLVNTYGAFGTVERRRHEVILLGTSDATPSPRSRWREYEFPCKPGDVRRRPCFVTPYHHRLQWQLWFASFHNYEQEPWIVHLVSKLLRGEPAVRALLERDPFPSRPPRWIRADLYRYRLTPFFDGSGTWWSRRYMRPYLRPIDRDDPEMAEFLANYGWVDD